MNYDDEYMNHNDSEFIKMVKEEVIERLENLRGTRHYPCDLGFQLTETENANGSWYCSRYEAREDIKKYLEEYEAYCGWFKATFGEPEYFESDPDDYHHDIESVHCRMMINAIESCFSVACNKAEGKGLFEEDFWDDEIEITQDFIDAIKVGLKEIKEVEDIW